MLVGYIYCVTCLVNEKWYFGQTRRRCVQSRMKEHIHSANMGSDHKFHRAIRKYGEDNFSIEEVMHVEAPTKEELKAKLDFLEKHFIQRYDTRRNGYNSTDGGEGCLGRSMSIETRERLREVNLGERNPMFGKKQSVEARIKLSKALKGKTSFFKGKHLTEEHKKKIGLANLGKTRSDKTKLKISLAKREQNIRLSDDEKRKRSIAQGGRPILQFNSNGVFMKEWVSLRSVFNELPIDRTRLKKHIASGTLYHDSYWRYKEVCVC